MCVYECVHTCVCAVFVSVCVRVCPTGALGINFKKKLKKILSGLSVLGALGINFVLMQATSGLEKKQKETYGPDSPQPSPSYGAEQY